MNKLLLLSLVLLASCYSKKEHEEQTDFKTNLDSLFEAADGAVELVTNNRKQKVLLEQDLWRKKEI
jgi:hypothetical protein